MVFCLKVKKGASTYIHYTEDPGLGEDGHWTSDPNHVGPKCDEVLSEPGTSGSPVFCVLPDGADKFALYLRGVHFAADSDHGHGVAFWMNEKLRGQRCESQYQEEEATFS